MAKYRCYATWLVLFAAVSAFAGQKKAPTVIIACTPDCVCLDKNEQIKVKCTLSDPDHVCDGTNQVFTITITGEDSYTKTYTGPEVTINSSELNCGVLRFSATLSDSKGLCALPKNIVNVHVISFSSTFSDTTLTNTASANGKPDKVVVTTTNLFACPKGGLAVITMAGNAADFRRLVDATGNARQKAANLFLDPIAYTFFPKTFPLPAGTMNITGTYKVAKCEPCPLTPPIVK